MLRDRADALDEPEARGVRVRELGDEHRAQDVDPRLALGRLARAEVGVWWGVYELLLRIPPDPGTEKTIRFLWRGG